MTKRGTPVLFEPDLHTIVQEDSLFYKKFGPGLATSNPGAEPRYCKMCCKKPGQILFIDRARRHVTSQKHVINLHKRYNPVPFIPFFLCPASHCDAKPFCRREDITAHCNKEHGTPLEVLLHERWKRYIPRISATDTETIDFFTVYLRPSLPEHHRARPVRPKRHSAHKTRTRTVQPAARYTDVTPATSAASDAAESLSPSEDADSSAEAEKDEDEELEDEDSDNYAASSLPPTNTVAEAVGERKRRHGGGHGHAASRGVKRTRADVGDDLEAYVDSDTSLIAEDLSEMSPSPTKRSRREEPLTPRSESSFELPDDFGGFCTLQPIFDFSGVPEDDMSWLFMPCPSSSFDALPKRLRKFLPSPTEIELPA